MLSHQNPFALFPMERFHVRLEHLYPGKVVYDQYGESAAITKRDCHGSKYYSTLTVTPRTALGDLSPAGAFQVTAKCSPNDTPRRAVAREVLRIKASTVARHFGYIE